jgi:hypothetical protein
MKGIPIHRLSNDFHIRKQTIYNWVERDKWDQVRIDLVKQATQNIDLDIMKEKERSLKLIRATESLYGKELQNATEMPRNVTGFAALQRVKWEILAPKSVTQFNFMKQENNGPSYRFEIVKPDNDDRHKVETKSETTPSV